MDLKQRILKKIDENGQITSREIIDETGYSRAYVNRFLRELRDEGKIVKLGRANQTRYVRANEESVRAAKADIVRFSRTYDNQNLQEDAVLDTIKRETGIFLDIPENIERILSYGFTEMLNNAIDHSGSEKIKVRMERTDESIEFRVRDFGIGIFKNIMQKKDLDTRLAAIQDLLKGKQTTAPEKHSGEGIFFTSKLADTLTFKSHEKKLQFNNRIDDIFISDISHTDGTDVLFSIDLDTDRTVKSVFREYTDEETYEFADTEVVVRLYEEDTEYLSRSQARRLLVGLDEFKTVVLDFAEVEEVGQAFCDQIFRVWARQHPDVKLEVKNADENVAFMVSRARGGGADVS